MTLRSYIRLLRLEDILHAHPFYFKAAKVAIDVYLHLHDNPFKSQSADEQHNQENLSPSELKKLKNKERKAKKRAELEQQAVAAAAEKKGLHQKSKQTSSEDGDSHQQDNAEELLPDKLASTVEPLQQAIKFLEPLLTLAPKNIQTHILAYEIYSRKDKPLLMLRSIRRALKVDPENETVQRLLGNFQETINSRVNSLPEPLPEFMRQELDKVYAFKKVKWLGNVGTLIIQNY